MGCRSLVVLHVSLLDTQPLCALVCTFHAPPPLSFSVSLPHCHLSLQANDVSCVGVIAHSQGGGLAASLSSSDLCGLLPEQFASALSMPVLQYLQAKGSAGWTAQQHARLQEQQQMQQQCQQPQSQSQQCQQQVQAEHAAAGSAQAWGLKVRQA